MRIPGTESGGRDHRSFVAADDASRLTEQASPLIDQARGIDWYHRPGSDVDLAAYVLCRLRRARAGELGGPVHGDEAVRLALGVATPEALVWLASRAVSYMDETGFPETIEPWLARAEEP